MERLYKILFSIAVLFLGCSLQSYSKAAPMETGYNRECIKFLNTASVQNNALPPQKDNILFYRSHNGIDESSTHFSKHSKKAQDDSFVKKSLYEVSHYFWNILAVHQEPPRHLDFSSASSLRAPPFC